VGLLETFSSFNLEVLRTFFNQVQSDVKFIARELEQNWHKKAGKLLFD
jgi:hypothetical protein